MAKDKQPEQPGPGKAGRDDPRRDGGAPDRARDERGRDRGANPDEIAETDLDKVAGGGAFSLPPVKGG